MQANLAKKQRRTIVIIDPHIKRDDNYKVYKEGKEGDFFVKDRNGNEYDGHCWSGVLLVIHAQAKYPCLCRLVRLPGLLQSSSARLLGDALPLR